MDKVKIAKIRPTSWKIYVQGKREAEYVRSALQERNLETSEVEQQPGLTDPALCAFTATYRIDASLTTEELAQVLASDPRVELTYEPQ